MARDSEGRVIIGPEGKGEPMEHETVGPIITACLDKFSSEVPDLTQQLVNIRELEADFPIGWNNLDVLPDTPKSELIRQIVNVRRPGGTGDLNDAIRISGETAKKMGFTEDGLASYAIANLLGKASVKADSLTQSAPAFSLDPFNKSEVRVQVVQKLADLL